MDNMENVAAPAQSAPAQAQQSAPAARPARTMHRRRKVCLFCADKINYIDYKDVNRLKKFINENGKILPRRVSGACAKHQREVNTAIKRARQMALVPYIID